MAGATDMKHLRERVPVQAVVLMKLLISHRVFQECKYNLNFKEAIEGIS